MTAFEHFVRSAEEMQELLSISPNILPTTSLAPVTAPQPKDWWYYGSDQGQHIGFYRVQALLRLADKFDLQLLTDGISTDLFSQNKYSHRAWPAFRQAAKRIPKLFLLGMRSKAWTDHLMFSKSN